MTRQQEYMKEKYPDIRKKFLELRTSSRRLCVKYPKGHHQIRMNKKK